MPPAQRYDAAKRAAEQWFAHLGKGDNAETVSVRTACERYVKHVRENRGDKPADDLDMRFSRWVFNREALASLDLSKLNKTRIEAWRTEMAKTPVVVISESSRIDPAVLPLALRTPGSAVYGTASVQGHKPRRDAEASLAALTSERWNVATAAKRLGISRATLHRKIVEFDLVRPKQR